MWPYVVIYQSVREVGFRYATLCCGLTAVLCSVRVYLRRAGRPTFLLLGIALGLGWWASAEIVYFAVPSLVLLVGWWTTSRPSSGRVHRVASASHHGGGHSDWSPAAGSSVLCPGGTPTRTPGSPRCDGARCQPTGG